jgi:hypothetical protein
MSSAYTAAVPVATAHSGSHNSPASVRRGQTWKEPQRSGATSEANSRGV